MNVPPQAIFLGEGYHRAGGVPAVIGELMQAGKIRENALTVTGKTMGENCREARSTDHGVIRTYDKPLKENAGLLVVSGNLFDSALIKTSVISDDFRKRYLAEDDCFTARAIVFEGPEDYRARIEDPALNIDETCMLVVRGAGPIGYPGSAEVVNMTPPATCCKRGSACCPAWEMDARAGRRKARRF